MMNFTLQMCFKQIVRSALPVMMIVCLLCACKKLEQMPPEVGAPVAYADSSLTLQQFMKKSPAYDLFWRAWQRSNIQKILKAYDPNYAFTLFVPDNNAMEAAGFDGDKIRTAPVAELDSLIKIHTVSRKLYPEALALQAGNLELNSFLVNSEYQDPIRDGNLPDPGYLYRHYLALAGGQILVNGKNLGPVSGIRVLKEATVFPISKILKKPGKSIRQILQEDGRFKMYLGIRRYNDSLYNAIVGIEQSYTYTTSFDTRYVRDKYGYGSIVPVLDYLSSVNYLYDSFYGQFEEYRQIYTTTILAPTDEAFHKAGFESLSDLIALNERALPFTDYPGSELLSGYLPTDSILNQHYWGNNSAWVKTGNSDAGGAMRRTPRQLMVLYSNDLRNEIMADFKVHISESGGKDYSMVNSLDFAESGGMTRIKVKGSAAEPATIIQKDIEAFNGVIHVVDRLLLPPGFKLH